MVLNPSTLTSWNKRELEKWGILIWGEREKETLEDRGITFGQGEDISMVDLKEAGWNGEKKGLGLRREVLGLVENGRGKLELQHTDPKYISEWWGKEAGISICHVIWY